MLLPLLLQPALFARTAALGLGAAALLQMAAAQRTVARDEYEVHGGKRDNDDDERDDPALAEEGLELRLYILASGKLHSGGIDELYHAVIVPAGGDADLAKLRSGLERGHELVLIYAHVRRDGGVVNIVGQEGAHVLHRAEDDVPVALGEIDRDFLGELGGGEQRAVGEVIKGPVVKVDGVFEVAEFRLLRVELTPAAHHHGEQADVAALRGGNEAVARGAGIARLDAGRALIEIVVAEILLRDGGVVAAVADKGVGVIELARLRHVGGVGLIIIRVAYHEKVGVADGLLGDEVHIVGRGIVPVV